MSKKKKDQGHSSDFLERKSRCKADIIFDAVIFVVLTILFLLVAYPLYFIVISSISDPIAVSQGKVTILPIGVTLDGYQAVFEKREVVRGFVNSLIITTLGVCINLLVTIPTAYALSRKDFNGRKAITIFYMITMFVSGGLMPTYLIVRNTGLIDSWLALIIPGALSVFNLIVARTFFQSNIPGELLEAGKLDGCGNTRFFIHIALPLSGAIMAIMILYYGVGHWNSYYSALLYIKDRELWPLQLELRSILIQNTSNVGIMTEEALKEKARQEALKEMMKYSLIVVSSVPVLILYPLIQRHFVKGVTIGSVKG